MGHYPISRPATAKDRRREYRRLRNAGFGRIDSFLWARGLVEVPDETWPLDTVG